MQQQQQQSAQDDSGQYVITKQRKSRQKKTDKPINTSETKPNADQAQQNDQQPAEQKEQKSSNPGLDFMYDQKTIYRFLNKMPMSKDALIGITAVCSDVASYIAHLATQVQAKTITAEGIISILDQLKIEGLKEKAEEILQYINTVPIQERKIIEKQQDEDKCQQEVQQQPQDEYHLFDE